VLILSRFVFGRARIPVHALDDILAPLKRLSLLPELQQMPGLDLEQTALNCGGTAQPP
jgi:hypothetical protein